MATYLPLSETITAEVACLFLGITFKQWVSRNWIARRGYKDKTTGEIRHTSYTFPEPISGGYSSPKAIYRTVDIVNVAADESIVWMSRKPISVRHLLAPVG